MLPACPEPQEPRHRQHIWFYQIFTRGPLGLPKALRDILPGERLGELYALDTAGTTRSCLGSLRMRYITAGKGGVSIITDARYAQG